MPSTASPSLRESGISRSILIAVYSNQTRANQSALRRFWAFWRFFQLVLVRHAHDLFQTLRDSVWRMNEESYVESFDVSSSSPNKEWEGRLHPIGDLGYSGSTFFTTPNSKFLIKSVPRAFEHEFFRDEMLLPYQEHMQEHSSSLLVRITDLLVAAQTSLGSILGLAPSHHIVMENTMYGRESDTEGGEAWESYDLKPVSYFFPERDVAGGHLASDATKERLAETFPDKIRITSVQKNELIDLLDKDTQFLQKQNVVDYSLFLIRYPARSTPSPVPGVHRDTTQWRKGTMDVDGRWQYRIVLLDFFWAKHKMQPKAMTALVESFNWLRGKRGQAPMSITTDPAEYRTRFMKMVEEYIEIVDE